MLPNPAQRYADAIKLMHQTERGQADYEEAVAIESTFFGGILDAALQRIEYEQPAPYNQDHFTVLIPGCGYLFETNTLISKFTDPTTNTPPRIVGIDNDEYCQEETSRILTLAPGDHQFIDGDAANPETYSDLVADVLILRKQNIWGSTVWKDIFARSMDTLRPDGKGIAIMTSLGSMEHNQALTAMKTMGHTPVVRNLFDKRPPAGYTRDGKLTNISTWRPERFATIFRSEPQA